MCLVLKSKLSKLQTAKNDIVVYKTLNSLKLNTIKNIKHGVTFSGCINGQNCHGQISIDNYGCIFLCTNNNILDGVYTDNRFGYKYSWKFDSMVENIFIDNKEVEIEQAYTYSTRYRYFNVEIGKTYTSKLIKTEEFVNEGLHSFKNIKSAKTLGYVVAKCIIPKGSRYYIGEFCAKVSYASDTLTYVEIVK